MVRFQPHERYLKARAMQKAREENIMKPSSTMDKIVKMMDFLGLKTVEIPYYGSPLPHEAMGDNYRPERRFTLHKNGTMTYDGWGHIPRGMKNDLTTKDIIPSQGFLDRTYSMLIIDTKEKALRKAKNSLIGNLANLLLRFNGISFVKITPDDKEFKSFR